MLNARNISSVAMPPRCCRSAKSGGTAHARAIDAARRSLPAASRGRFSVMPPPVMCAMPFDEPGVEQRPQRRAGSDRCGASSASPTVAPSSGTNGVGASARRRRTARGAPASSRSCAGRPTAGRSARRPATIARPSITSRLLDDADDEAGDVVLAVGVEARHLRGLAADQRAAVLAAAARDAGDDLLGDVRRQPAGREVVEEEQRLGALHEDVVDAVVDEVGADRVVAARS